MDSQESPNSQKNNQLDLNFQYSSSPDVSNVYYNPRNISFQNFSTQHISSFDFQNFNPFTSFQNDVFSPPLSHVSRGTSKSLNGEDSSQASKKKWSKEATVLLISAWLNTSKDAVVGTDQTSSRFWDRIATYFNINDKEGNTRSGKQCKDHWGKINQKMTRFNGCYKRVQQARHSGWSDDQIMENAHQLYKSENKNSSFQFVECWRLLQNEPKWNALGQQEAPKRTKVSESGQYTSSSNADFSENEVQEVRPIGQKTAKKRCRGKEKEKQDMHAAYMEINERKVSALEKLVTIREKEAEEQRLTKYMDYLVMDTTHMSIEQKDDHDKLCAHIRTNIFKF